MGDIVAGLMIGTMVGLAVHLCGIKVLFKTFYLKYLNSAFSGMFGGGDDEFGDL